MPGSQTGPDERLLAAHRALRQQGDIQFTMGKAPVAEPPPRWLVDFFKWLDKALAPVGKFFEWLGSFLPPIPIVRYFFWGLLGLLALFVLWIVVDRVRHGVWRLPRLRRRSFVAGGEEADEESWRPDETPAREWLKEADALAAQGHYAQAAHHLLLRSVEDLAQRRPQLVRPALTSRDLARAEAIPEAPRRLFAQIAAVVERSLFGGRPVQAEDWGDCRAAYADFAQIRSWAR